MPSVAACSRYGAATGSKGIVKGDRMRRRDVFNRMSWESRSHSFTRAVVGNGADPNTTRACPLQLGSKLGQVPSSLRGTVEVHRLLSKRTEWPPRLKRAGVCVVRGGTSWNSQVSILGTGEGGTATSAHPSSHRLWPAIKPVSRRVASTVT